MKKLSKYVYMVKLKIAEAITYAFDFAGRSVFFAFIILIYLMLWQTIYGDGKVEIEGFTLNMMIWYLIVTEMVTLSNIAIHQDVAEDVKSGQIAYMLSKPYSYIGYQFTNFFGRSSIRLLINTVIGISIGLLLVGPLENFKLYSIPFIILSIILGMTLDFTITLCLSLSAFWVEENAPFRWIYQKLVFTLGGMLMPIDLFPVWLQDLVRYLPFTYVTYAPAKTAVDFSFAAYGTVLCIQGLYILLFIGISLLIYRKGVRALNVNGG
ncbi:ABC transporter permease [Vallitalea okinawensis]|uniref:ABC transporter permease n=1 Tax=Vallitalea okinawensis TaxID=2078660 RepID=UPI0014786A25|nr:ABC transporter permease [Vallitalea okinawensis]